MRAVGERRPERLNAKTYFQPIAVAMNDIGHHIDSFIQRDQADHKRLMTLERRSCTIGDGVGKDLALAGDLPPIKIPMAIVDARGSREELMLSAALVVLDDQSFFPGSIPIGFRETAWLGRLPGDAKRVVQASHYLTLCVRGQDHHDAATPVASVWNAADTRDQSICRVFHLPLVALTEQLPDRLDEIGPATGESALTSRNLSAAGVERKVTRMSEIELVDETATLAVLAESEHLQLKHDRDNEIVIGMERCDVGRLEAGLHEGSLAGDVVSALGRVDDRLTRTVIGALAVANRYDNFRESSFLGLLAASHEQPTCTVADHHAVEQSDGIGNHARTRDSRRC